MAAARKTPKKTAAAKTGVKSKGAKPRPVETPRPLSESDASQVLQNKELRRAQMELEAARDRYVELYDFSPAGHFTLDMQSKIVEANLRAGTLLGANRKELIGQPLARFIAAVDEGTFHRHYQEVLRTGTRQTCEVRLRKEAGVSHWVHFESLAVHNEPGHITHWRTALLDISDRKRAEDEVRRSETFISSILENLPAMIFVKEAKDLRFVRLNKAGEDLLGYLRGELMGKNDYDFFPQDEADFFTAKDREVLACGRLLDIPQEPIQTRSGEVRYLHTKKIPIVGKDGTPQYLLGISEDITDRKRVEEALRLAKFSMDRTADAVYWIDSQAKILDVNEAASLMLGYSKDELCAMTVHDLNPDLQADMWPGFWAETQRRGTIVLETAHRAKTGRLIPIEVSVNYLSYEGKEYHCAFVRDISERKRAAEEIAQLAERLELATSAGQIGVWDWNIRKNELVWDDRMFALYGVKKEDFGGAYDAWLSGVHPVDRARCDEAIQQALRKEKPYDIEFRIRWPNGTVRVIKADGQVVWGMDGTPLRMTGVNYDITERMRAEEELRESEARLQAILDNSPGMVFLKDVEGRYLHVNRQFERVFHMTREHIVGKTDEAIFVPEQAAVFRANDLKVLQSGVPFEFEEVAMHDDGPHTSIVSKFPLYGGDGKPYALCGITTDITWRKIAEQALQASDAFTRAVLDSLSAHVCVLDNEGVIVKTNDAWKEFGCRNSGRGVPIIDVGQNYLDVCRRASAAGDSTAQATLDGIEVVLGGSQPSFSTEYACHSPEEERWFLMRVTPLKDKKGVVISHTDISRQVRMGLVLEKHVLLLSEKQKDLESLTGKLIGAQENERKRIARELHDDFNQRLAALSVELESMERTPITSPEPVVRQLAAIRVEVGQLSDDLHDLAYRLHPSLLEHVGLEVAVRDHVAEFAKRTGLPVTFTAREVPETLSSEVATNLFRVMQESLQNVSKHAQATGVTVRLSGSSKGIGLSVRDNGKGFSHENKKDRAKGLGLVSMEERARGLGGFLRIHSMPMAGTKVCAWIPRIQEGA